jgi:hypothetical protein
MTRCALKEGPRELRRKSLTLGWQVPDGLEPSSRVTWCHSHCDLGCAGK